MAIQIAEDFGLKLCKVLGLDPAKIGNITINIEPGVEAGITINIEPGVEAGNAVRLNIVRHLQTDEAAEIIDELENYTLTPKLFPPSVDDH